MVHLGKAEDNYRSCKQCGELKPVATGFRKYYKGKGYYRTCLECERINNRRKYLQSIIAPATLQPELQAILDLYAAQRRAGLSPPAERVATGSTFIDSVRKQIEQLSTERDMGLQAKSIDSAAGAALPLPSELQTWLNYKVSDYQSDNRDPDDLYAQFDDLEARYRPVLQIDPVTFDKVYDERFAAALRSIYRVLSDYEDLWMEE